MTDSGRDPGGHSGAGPLGTASAGSGAQPLGSPAADLEGLLRTLAPQVLGALIRRYRDFATCEDALQEALLAAATHWRAKGVPENPRGWLLQTAGRRFTDLARSEQARHRREERAAARERPVAAPASGEDDTLLLLFLCCNPALTPASQAALTLRAVGGLTTAEIARAYLVPEATMAQRISRAKQRISHLADGSLAQPADPSRVRAVLSVLYLIFNEGYTASAGAHLQRVELSEEAIRLTGELHRLLPDDGEVSALLALMLLTDARRPARTGPDGELIPLGEQDRGRWDRRLITAGTALLDRTMGGGSPGEYRLQAAIAALHDRAPRAADTDWGQILALYDLLEQLTANPVVTLNKAVALAMVEGPAPGLELLATLEVDGRLAGHHRLHAVRGHLLELAGDRDDALRSYREAALLTTSLPERRYLLARAAGLRRH